MHVIIMVMAGSITVFAQGIQNRIIGSGYDVDNSFVDKCLQRAIYRHPVKVFTGVFLNVGMRQRTIAV